MKTFMMVQYTPEWWEARRGLATASSFDAIFTPKTAKLSDSIDNYIVELIGDIRDMNPNAFSERGRMGTKAMEAGRQSEPEARRWYEMTRGLEVQQVGGCLSACGRWWCSPDGLVGADGLLELKCPLLKTHARYLLDGTLPSTYRPQVHGQLIVTRRTWVDFMSYAVGMDPFIVRVERDAYTDKLEEALEVFDKRYHEVYAKVVGGGSLAEWRAQKAQQMAELGGRGGE